MIVLDNITPPHKRSKLNIAGRHVPSLLILLSDTDYGNETLEIAYKEDHIT